MGFDQFPHDANDEHERLEREREEAEAEEEREIFWRQLLADERSSAEAFHRDSAAGRVQAHRWFDLVWKRRYLSRKAAYAWLQKEMGLPDGAAHISTFSEAQCLRAVELAKAYLVKRQGRAP